MEAEQREVCADAQLAVAPESTGESKNKAEATEIEARLMEAEQREARANAQLAAARERTGEFKNKAEAAEIEARRMEAEQREAFANVQAGRRKAHETCLPIPPRRRIEWLIDLDSSQP